MSLIHLALDKVERMDPKPVQHVETKQVAKIPIPPETQDRRALDHEPRIDSVRFYESLDQETAKAIGQISKPNFWKDQRVILSVISFLLFCSLFAARGMMPAVSKDQSEAPVFYQPTLPERPTTAQIMHQKAMQPVSPQKSRFVLTGITSTEGTRLAVINGQVVGEGDNLRDGGQVKSITDKKVIVKYQFREITLNFD